MKKIAILLVVLSALLSFTACLSHKEATIPEGTYRLTVEENEAFAPSLIIADGTFTFTYDLLSSYSNSGTFSLEDDILTLTTSDKERVYRFQVKDNALIFDEKNSDSVRLLDERMGVQLKDGDSLQFA